jgi:hypothetical protein
VPLKPQASEEKEVAIKKALYTSQMTTVFRALFAALLWHCDIVDDAMSLAAYLKFNSSVARPTKNESHDDEHAALLSFTSAPPQFAEIKPGSPVLVMTMVDEVRKFVRGTVVEKVKHLEQPVDETFSVKVGMRFEARDRLNPGLICLSIY